VDFVLFARQVCGVASTWHLQGRVPERIPFPYLLLFRGIHPLLFDQLKLSMRDAPPSRRYLEVGQQIPS